LRPSFGELAGFWADRRQFLGRSLGWLAGVGSLSCQLKPASSPSDDRRPSAEPLEAPPASAPARAFDAHLHLPPGVPFDWSAFRQASGLESGLNLSGGWPGGRLERALEDADGRWLVAVSLPWHLSAHPDFPSAAARAIRRAAELGARALKIDKALGLSALCPSGELWPIDAAALDPLFDAAGAENLPVFIHSGDPEAFWRPTGPDNPRAEELAAHPSWSYHGRAVPAFETLWTAFADRVERHPGTRFVGVHFGNRAEAPSAVGTLLDRLPNLWIDVAARLPELGRHPPDAVRPVFLRHRKRILFGSDFAALGPDAFMLGSTGERPDRFEDIQPFYQRSWDYLATRATVPSMTPIQGRHALPGLGLPRPVLEDLYVNNAERLFEIGRR